MLGLGRAEGDRLRLGGIEVVDHDVEMHLLGYVLPRPLGRGVVVHLLERDALAVVRADVDPVRLDLGFPVQHGGVEGGQGGRVRAVEDDARKACDSHAPQRTRYPGRSASGIQAAGQDSRPSRAACRPARRPKNDPSPSWAPETYPLPSWAMLEAQAPAAYSPAMTEPSGRRTSPSTVVRSPPRVNPAYSACPGRRSNTAHGPWSCAASQSALLPKSGSSPRAAKSLYRASVLPSDPAGTP